MTIDHLRAALGDMLSTEADVLEKHACDWSKVDRQLPLAVLRPRNVTEVAQALRTCNELGLAVVPQAA